MEEALRAHGEADPTWPTSDRTVSVDTPRGRAVARPDEAAVSTDPTAHDPKHSLDIRPPMRFRAAVTSTSSAPAPVTPVS